MRRLTKEETDFFKGLLNYSIRKYKYCFWQPRNQKYGIKKYKVHRILMQLHLGMKLELWEVVHHKDGNKLNNKIGNLEVLERGNHSSIHGGGKKIGNFKPHNKFSEEKVNKILELSKINLKSNGKPNCSKIGKIMGIAGMTISKYVVTSKK